MDVFALLRKREISEDNKKIIGDFLKFRKASGLSERRLRRIEFVLSTFSKIVKKKITETNQSDLIKFCEWLESQNYAENTLLTYRKILKNFYRHIFDGTLPKWIAELLKTKSWVNNLTPQDILKPEEIEKMLNATQSIRRKAILMTGYEAALRPHELLSLKVGDIEFTEWGARLFVRKSKTKQRTIPLLESSPLLSQYLNRAHPKRENPQSFLWVNDRGKPITMEGFRKLLKDLAKKAGVEKPVFPYLLRHSRLTYLSRILQPSEVKKIAGWSNIKMLDVYEHLSSTDIEDALLKKYGIKKQEESKKPPYIRCARCGALNETGSRYCFACGLCLSDEEIFESEKYLEIGKKVLLKEHIRKIIKEEIRKMLEKGEIEL